MAVDFEQLKAPIAGDAPCGPDLRAEPDFRDIEDATGEFAQQTVADLRKVVARCGEFLARTKDQMPAIVAVQAAIRAGDLDVANGALDLIKSFAETYWEDFHPGPAEEMAIGRVNELSALARPAAMILPLQRTALVRMPAPSGVEFNAAMLAQAGAPVLEWTSDNETALGVQVKSGALSSGAAKTVKATHEGARLLRAVMRAIAPEALAADRAAGAGETDGADTAQTAAVAVILRAQAAAASAPMQAMSDLLYDIMAVYEGHAVDTPSFGPVIAQLKSINEAIAGFLAVFPDPLAVAPAVSDDAVPAGGEVTPAVSASGPVRPAAFAAGTPQTRADVLAAIDAICRFYAENEPSSPVPLMLRRIQGWVNKDFMQLIREIAPEGAEQVTKLLAIAGE